MEVRQTYLKNTWRMKTFWVACQNVVDTCWIFKIIEASGLFY